MRRPQWVSASVALPLELGIYNFLPRRFEMSAQQVAFLDDLPHALCYLWATQIAYALREGIPIELVKPEAKKGRQSCLTLPIFRYSDAPGLVPGWGILVSGSVIPVRERAILVRGCGILVRWRRTTVR